MTRNDDDEKPVGGDPASVTPTPAAESEKESARPPETGGEPSPERPLMADALMDFRARWEAIQQGFVDDPQAAVTDADTLVKEVLQALSATFDEQQQDLERQWSEGEPSTEDLRAALQRYRDFFQRLLAI